VAKKTYVQTTDLFQFLIPFQKYLKNVYTSNYITTSLRTASYAKNQYGFTKHFSISDAVMDACNEILGKLKWKKITCSIFLDLAKAFGSINHSILLKKLEKYGICGLLLKLFTCYLLNRQQYTRINNEVSEINRITCEVPQGSTLGPLLFNIYINDLLLATKFQTRLFADDANITASHHQINKLENMINNELNHISNWMKINKLTINYKKTEYIIATNKKSKPTLNLKIDENKINQSTSIKYLGVIIDDTLKWTSWQNMF